MQCYLITARAPGPARRVLVGRVWSTAPVSVVPKAVAVQAARERQPFFEFAEHFILVPGAWGSIFAISWNRSLPRTSRCRCNSFVELS